MTLIGWMTAGIALMTYAAVAVGYVPGLRMNRATIALIGAALLVVTGALTEEQAFSAIDLGTLILLAAMMVINVNLYLSGFFENIASRVVQIARTPSMLLALIVGVSGVLSAIFINDAICISFTPLVLDLTQHLKRNPLPYLIGLATAANIGSVATITGNPQNLIIGQASQIPYLRFLLMLGPVALAGLVICWLVLWLAYREEFRTPFGDVEPLTAKANPALLTRTLVVVAGLMVAFLAGLPIVTSASVAAGLLLISRIRPEKLLAIDWGLLVFFSGMFVVTGAIEVTGVSGALFSATAPVLRSSIAAFSLVTVVLSNIVSNVPAVLLLRPEIAAFPNTEQAWLALAMSSTLAGNLTLLGSAATLIVAELASTRRFRLGFVSYLRVGIPVTLLTMAVGIGWITLIY